MKVVITLISLFSLSVFAGPKQVTVVFLSETKVSFKTIIPHFKQSMWLAKSSGNCIPMGDGCFNPQTGFSEIKKTKFSEKMFEEVKEKNTPFKLKTFNSQNVNMIDCREGNFFDIFCGKAQKEKKQTGGVDIFVDISSSMKHVDGDDGNGYCARRYFISELKNKCQNLSVYGFDTRLLTGTSGQGLCINYGLNDRKRAVKWINNSDADFLLAITDLEEYQGEFRVYLDKIGAKLYGLGVDDFMASKLKSLIPDIVKQYCKK